MTDQPRQASGGGAPGMLAGRWAVSLGGAALLLMIVFPPAAPVPAVAALVIGVRARRRARNGQPAVRGARAGVIMGSIALIVSIPLATMQIAFWGELDRYLNCHEAANTVTDEQACKQTLRRELEQKLHLREGSLDRYNGLL